MTDGRPALAFWIRGPAAAIGFCRDGAGTGSRLAQRPAGLGLDAVEATQAYQGGQVDALPACPLPSGERPGGRLAVLGTWMQAQRAYGPEAGDTVRPRSGRAVAVVSGLGLVFIETKAAQNRETPQRRGIPGIDLASQWCHHGVTITTWNSHGQNPHDAAPARRSDGRISPRGRATGHQLECLYCAGGAQLDHLPAPTIGPTGGNASIQTTRTVTGGEGRAESALPLRQRTKVQAVSRQAGHLKRSRGNVGRRASAKVRHPASFDRRPGAAIANATGGAAPRGMMT